MFEIVIKTLILLIISSFVELKLKPKSDSECMNIIHRSCNHATSFTELELENAKNYLQQRFAKTNPIGKPCNRLRVRKDIKCLTPTELQKFINVFKLINTNGILERFTRIHSTYWTWGHKSSEGLQWHRWFLNEMEKEMIKLDPTVTMPYWEYFSEFAHPEKSIIWEFFGHAGTKSQNYCVSDGPFANFTVNFPTPHCLRRQWNEDGTIYPWENAEWVTSINQIGFTPTILLQQLIAIARYVSPDLYLEISKELARELKLTVKNPSYKGYSPYILLLAFIAHFKTHLAIGGFNGDLSLTWATNDIIFYLFHAYQADLEVLKWQLTDNNKLVPKSYDLGIKLDYNKGINKSNLATDQLIYYNVSLIETFQVGFGELCYIYDRLIKPINKIMNKEKVVLPLAVQRLKKALLFKKFAFYFPKFALLPHKVTHLDFILPKVGNCNPMIGGFCRKMPVAKRYNQTPENIRQFQVFITDTLDISGPVLASEDLYYQFMEDLNKSNYCSPYV